MTKTNLEYVSFDVFGTLVNRAIPVRQIFELLGQAVRKKGIAIIDDFANSRELAEKKARKKHGNNYTLEEIYQSFSPGLSEEQIRKIADLERKFEVINAEVNQRGRKLYDKYKGKREILAISDMYLDQRTIGEILSKNGYEIDKIYVSSEYKKSKRERRLFKEVINRLRISKKNIMHIGDAKRSDYLNARLAGIRSRLIQKDEKDYFYKLGFNIFGPMMYNFCGWLKKNIDRNEEKKVLFVSREGEIICKFYVAMSGEDEGSVIYLSRKSVLAGTSSILLEKYTISDIIEMISMKRNETFGEFLMRLGLDEKKFAKEMREDKISGGNSLDRVDVGEFFERHNQKIQRELRANSEIFDQYLKENLSKKNLLIDVGWKGSMQELLTKYLESKHDDRKIEGLYFGCTNTNEKKGFLFSENNSTCQEALNYAGLLEVVLMPEYGSVIGYQMKNGKIVPRFDEEEFSKESMKKIKKIQRGVLDFILKMREFGEEFELGSELSRFGNQPSLKDAKTLGELEFYDNGRSYFLARVDWWNLKGSFLDCKWKTAFLKQIFRINLPYDRIVIALRNRGNKKIGSKNA